MARSTDSKIFVRAKPNKISINETYYYKKEIGDNTVWEFIKAEGEIKLEYPFDGNYYGHFDHTARKDLKKQDPTTQVDRAIVGYLAITKAGKSSWNGLTWEKEPIPIKLNVKDIRKNLEASQKYSILFQYRPERPENRPFFLKEIKLTDQEPFQDEGSDTATAQYYPFPTLRMTWQTPMRGELTSLTDLSDESLKALVQRVKDGWLQNTRPSGNDFSISNLAKTLVDLAGSNRGGVLLIGVDLNGDILGFTENDESSIEESVAQAVLSSEYPVPILKPAIKAIKSEENENKKIAVVAVSPFLKDRHRQQAAAPRFTLSTDTDLNSFFVKEEYYSAMLIKK